MSGFVFDWHKAARLIVARQPAEVSAGLLGDWNWTGGCIWRNGAPVMDEYTYLASSWCRATISLNEGPEELCFVSMDEQPNWTAETKWPRSALDILEGKAE